MTERTAFDQLCEYCNIQGSYYDIQGHHHVASIGTKLALLRAMGATIADETEAAVALEQLQTREWLRTATPVKVMFEHDATIQFSLSLPSSITLSSPEWYLELENGEHLSGLITSARPIATRVIDSVAYSRYLVEIQIALPLGYHQLQFRNADTPEPLASIQVIVCPRQCFQPPALADGRRIWGLTVQLYALRSQRNWGIGDFSDLKKLAEIATQFGASIVGTNPLHALFPDQPEQASPYSPSNRAALNILYLDVEAIADYAESTAARTRVQSPEFQSILETLRATDLVNYTEVARIKFEILRVLYQHFREQHVAGNSARAQAFHEFKAHTDPILRINSVFDALQQHFHTQDASVTGWQQWPLAFHDPQSPAVAEFCDAHQGQIGFFDYLQWQAELQLGAVNQRCQDSGMPLGLYHDLALGANAGGAETWLNSHLYASQAHLGAPHDDFNPKGQDWGIPPPIPDRLVGARYEPFVTILRAAMRHSQALRVDHVMGLMRLFWLPVDATTPEGAYIKYPLWDLMGLLALESQRQQCLIVGEDLGTVPDEVRSAMNTFGILSYRLLYFSRNHDEEFMLPEHYPVQSLCAIATHDLPTLRGFWTGADLAIREKLMLYPNEEAKRHQQFVRQLDRERLLRALERVGLSNAEISVHGAAAHDFPPALAQAIHIYLGRSQAKLLTIQPEDIFGQINQINVPSTTSQYPNWRYKVALNLEDWCADLRLQALANALREMRGAPVR